MSYYIGIVADRCIINNECLKHKHLIFLYGIPPNIGMLASLFFFFVYSVLNITPCHLYFLYYSIPIALNEKLENNRKFSI